MPSQPRLTARASPQEDAPPVAPRLQTLDLIRGVAVLGILAINIAGFAGPTIGTISPVQPHPIGPVDQTAWAFGFLVFEGKMRALFTLLFGAGLVLFHERADAAGKDADQLQLRRLGWLLLFGIAHYLLLWWGDILFLYAACGLAALMMRPLNDRLLLWIALALYYAWHIGGMLEAADAIAAERAVRAGAATATQADVIAQRLGIIRNWVAQDMHEASIGWAELLRLKLLERPFWQIQMLSGAFSETLPLMLIGMTLYRRGFFTGGMPRKVMVEVSGACILAALVLTGLFLAWAWPRGFPPIAMQAALAWGLAMPHLLGGVGYAGVLVLAAPRLTRAWPGRLLTAAGRMAFSNYIATSIVMTFVFSSWGLDLYAKVTPARQWLFVLGGWALMLAWSPLWLRHFRRGPLEWLWRCLVEHRLLANRRAAYTAPANRTF